MNADQVTEGQWVECTDSRSFCSALTIGKRYQVLRTDDKNQIFVRDDTGYEFGYFAWRFRLVDDHATNLLHAFTGAS